MTSDLHLIVLALTGRRLATNCRGYLGMNSEQALRDCVIAVLCGCNFPIALFPCMDRYYVSGECYVDRVLNGELMGARNPESINRERDYALLKSLPHQYRETALDISEASPKPCRETPQQRNDGSQHNVRRRSGIICCDTRDDSMTQDYQLVAAPMYSTTFLRDK
jgi:hypothetical protein